jgi:hypothetical protein
MIYAIVLLAVCLALLFCLHERCEKCKSWRNWEKESGGHYDEHQNCRWFHYHMVCSACGHKKHSRQYRQPGTMQDIETHRRRS